MTHGHVLIAAGATGLIVIVTIGLIRSRWRTRNYWVAVATVVTSFVLVSLVYWFTGLFDSEVNTTPVPGCDGCF